MYSSEGHCKQCPLLRSSPAKSGSIASCHKTQDDEFIAYIFIGAFIAFHVVTYAAFVVASGWDFCPEFGVNYTGWVMIELALLDAFMDYLYYFTEAFATEQLYLYCGVFLFVPQIVPGIACFFCVSYVTFAQDERKNQLWKMPFGMGQEDMADIVNATTTVIYNVVCRPLYATFLSILFALFWNMKVLAAFLFLPLVSEQIENAEAVGLQLLALMVYNELVVENVPQLCIQVMNNNQREEGWTTTSIVSMATSMAFVIKGLFEPTFKICVLRSLSLKLSAVLVENPSRK